MDSIRSIESMESVFKEILKNKNLEVDLNKNLNPILSYFSKVSSFYCKLGNEDKDDFSKYLELYLKLLLDSVNDESKKEVSEEFYKEVVNRMEKKEEDLEIPPCPSKKEQKIGDFRNDKKLERGIGFE